MQIVELNCVELAYYKIGCIYPPVGSFELQVKQPKKLGHLYPIDFSVYNTFSAPFFSHLCLQHVVQEEHLLIKKF